MAVAAIVAVVGLERGLQSEPTEADAEPVSDDLSATADDPVT